MMTSLLSSETARALKVKLAHLHIGKCPARFLCFQQVSGTNFSFLSTGSLRCSSGIGIADDKLICGSERTKHSATEISLAKISIFVDEMNKSRSVKLFLLRKSQKLRCGTENASPDFFPDWQRDTVVL